MNEIREWIKSNGFYADEFIKYEVIEGFPNHIISSDGRVFLKSYTDRNGRVRKSRELTKWLNHDGYERVVLSHEGKRKGAFIHRLLGKAFIPKVEGKDTINHIDGIKTNNAIKNLEWADRKEQMQHAYKLGLKKYTPVMKTMAIKKSGRPVKLTNKLTGLISYHITARDCSKFAGMSKRWCDKIIGTQDGETRRYSMEYVTLKELKENSDNSSLNSLVELVNMWSIDRGLHKVNSDKQLLKVSEEVAEVIQSYLKDQPEELKLELGDVLVTLIIFAQQQDIDLYECLELAYDKIANRKGELVDGTYIKQEDLIKLKGSY